MKTFKIISMGPLHRDKEGLMISEGIIGDNMNEEKYKMTAATFECKECGERVTLLQEEHKIKEPLKCKCGKCNWELIMRKIERIPHIQWEVGDINTLLETNKELLKVEKTIRNKLTEGEIQFLSNCFWFSPMMQSIRTHLANNDKRLTKLESNLKKTR